jgi:hypothetical protein
VEAVSDLLAETPDGRVTIPTTMRVRYPREFRIDSKMPGGTLVQVFNSGQYWVEDGRGVKILSGEAAEAMRQNVVRDPIALLLALNDRRLSVRRAPDVTAGGRVLPALVVDMARSGPLTLVLDPESWLIVRQRYPARWGGGEVEEVLSDYRDVKGLQVAFTVTVRHPGERPITRVLRRFDYNVPLDSALFARPS